MMETLGTEPGSIIEVKNVTLPLGSFVKIQPQSTDFLDISDHRAVYILFSIIQTTYALLITFSLVLRRHCVIFLP